MHKELTNWPLSDPEKLKRILKATQMTRSELASALEVNYKAVYRWLDQGVKPHPRQAADIDALFKEHVDLRPVLSDLKRTLADPIRILKSNPAKLEKFFLELTYNSNAIEGSRMDASRNGDDDARRKACEVKKYLKSWKWSTTRTR